MRKIFTTIFSGEFLFALFLVAGSFKEAIKIPLIDETVFLLGMTVLIAFKRLSKNNFRIAKRSILPIVLFSFIILIAFVSLSYSPSSVYAKEKIMIFSVISGWCFVAPFFLFKDEGSLKRFFLGFVSLSLIMACNMIVNGLNTGIGFREVFGSSYVQLARVTAMGALVFLSYFIFTNRSGFPKIIALILTLVLFVPLIQSGSRLPVIAVFFALLTVPLSMIKIKKDDILISKKIIPLFSLFIVVIASLSFYVSKGYAETLLYRLDSVFDESGEGVELTGRSSRFDIALDMSADSYLLGKGLGSFPIHYSGIDQEDYPHSIYLELLSELGIISLVIFLSIILASIYNGYLYYKKHGLNYLNTSLYLILLFWLVNSFGSSSMTGDRTFYAVLAILFVLPSLGRKTVNIATKNRAE